jgi:hypothetical protein
MNVYKLHHERDEDGLKLYQDLIVSGWQMSDKLEEHESRYGWFGNHQPIGDAWFPVKIVVDKDSYSQVCGDYPMVHGFSSFFVTPILSQRAVDALADLLEEHGELLPFICDSGKYYAFNITREVAALDEEHSEFKFFSELYPDAAVISPDSANALCIAQFVFQASKVADFTIFKLLSQRSQYEMPLVTDRFVQRVQDANLKGFAFKLLWSSENE